MNIFIKNMVCNRCVMVVSNIFHEAGFSEADVQLGKVYVTSPISDEKLRGIEEQLKHIGFEVINDSKSRLIEHIKNIVIDVIYNHPTEIKFNYSEYLASQLNLDYNYLSTLFSSVEGTTIEKYMINLKTERVKELLVYDEKTLSEISFEMGYSSVAHLSGQFKKVTGFTPTYFKKLGEQRRKSIDEV
ncbi:MAG: helix-turn-helix domain-containing protein [Paludibacter sp.]